jgi:hypothetical protein
MTDAAASPGRVRAQWTNPDVVAVRRAVPWDDTAVVAVEEARG